MYFARRLSIMLFAALSVAQLHAQTARPERLQAPAVRSLELNNAAALKLASLERELQQIQLGPVFTAAALTSPARVAQGQATIERLRSLTARRSEIARAHAAELVPLRRAAPEALAAIDNYLSHGQRVHEQLHTARIDVADQADDVLAWAAAQGDSIRVEHNRVRMSAPEQQQRFNELFARLEGAMASHDKAVDASEAFRKANQGRLNGQPIPPQGKPTR